MVPSRLCARVRIPRLRRQHAQREQGVRGPRALSTTRARDNAQTRAAGLVEEPIKIGGRYRGRDLPSQNLAQNVVPKLEFSRVVQGAAEDPLVLHHFLLDVQREENLHGGAYRGAIEA